MRVSLAKLIRVSYGEFDLPRHNGNGRASTRRGKNRSVDERYRVGCIVMVRLESK